MKKNFYSTNIDYLKPAKKITDKFTGDNAVTVIDGEVWLEKQAVMERLHISERTLLNWRKNKLLRFARIGGRCYYPEADLGTVLKKSMG